MPKRNHNAEALMREALRACGLDLTSPDMQDTPLRVCRWIQELSKNQGKEPKLTTKAEYDPTKEIKLTTFDGNGIDELVVYTPIEYQSACCHHLLPFSGTVAVGYLPSQKIIGASKIPRLVDFFSRQPTTQEYLTNTIAKYVQKVTASRFVGVLMTGTHTCMSCRGVRKQGVIMKTSCILPSNDASLKAEFLKLAG